MGKHYGEPRDPEPEAAEAPAEAPKPAPAPTPAKAAPVKKAAKPTGKRS